MIRVAFEPPLALDGGAVARCGVVFMAGMRVGSFNFTLAYPSMVAPLLARLFAAAEGAGVKVEGWRP